MPEKKTHKLAAKTWLNLRKEPEGEIIKILEPGEVVTLTEDGETWVKVTCGAGKQKQAGFCMKVYLKKGV